MLSLKALTAYASQARRAHRRRVTWSSTARTSPPTKYDGDDRDPLVFSGLGQHLLAGKNHIELKHSGRTPMPYSVAIDYRSLQPERRQAREHRHHDGAGAQSGQAGRVGAHAGDAAQQRPTVDNR